MIAMLQHADMFTLQRGGPILTSYGNYEERDPVRCRVSFLPDADGDRRIGGLPYFKVGTQLIEGRQGMIELVSAPGDQQFLVGSEFAQIFRCAEALGQLPEEDLETAQAFIHAMSRLGVPIDSHAIGGSRALGCARRGSDFDWIIRTSDQAAVERVKKHIESDSRYSYKWPFTKDHLLQKYSGRLGDLTDEDILGLFHRPSKYFMFSDAAFSLSFDSGARSGSLVSPQRLGIRQRVDGVVESSEPTMPTRFSVRTTHGSVAVLTWRFIYSGAFEQGNRVEVEGEWVSTAHGPAILVENHRDFVRRIPHR